jgi:hypothetical protein
MFPLLLLPSLSLGHSSKTNCGVPPLCFVSKITLAFGQYKRLYGLNNIIRAITAVGGSMS